MAQTNAIFAGVRLPLRYKILGVTGLSLCVMSLFFLVIFVGIYERRLIDDYTNASVQINSLLEASLENAMLKRDMPGLQEIVRRLGEQPSIDGVFILDPNLEIRFSHERAVVGEIFQNADSSVFRGQTDTVATFIEGRGGESATVLRSINPVLNKKACETCHGRMASNSINGYLVIDYAAGAIGQDARQTALTLALFGGFVVLLAIIVISWALRRIVVRPLTRMGETSLAIADGNLNARTGVTGDDEIGWLGASFDRMATEIESQREKLQRNRGFIQAVIDAVPDGIRVIGSDYRIHMVNKAYCDQQGTMPESVVGQPCYRSSHALQEPCAASMVSCPHFEFSSGQNTVFKCRHRHVTCSGHERFVEVCAGRLEVGPDGEPGDFFVESIRDLADQIALSKEHRLSEIGHLATGVAHEIYNPLSSISLAIRSISLDTANTDDYFKIAPYLQIVNDEVDRCIDITRSLLTLSRSDSNQRVLVDLNEAVNEVLSLLAFDAEEDKIDITVRADPGVRVLASPSDIHMLILNLVQNAFHAMPDGGELSVTLTRTAERVILTIADKGYGIEPENLAKVFWPFWSMRADNSAGTGLGLAICRSIVESHNGTIDLTSTLGKGTQFEIGFPAADRAVSEG